MDYEKIAFKNFYSVLANYLLRNNLIDKMIIDEKHLVVREASSGLVFEFVLEINRLEQRGESCTNN